MFRSLVRNPHGTVLAVGGIGEAGSDVSDFQLREVFDDLVFRHAFREHGKDVMYRDSQPANASVSATFATLEGDSRFVVHFLR
jgi:hypothetical protein